jgi:hypothetical protein
MKLEIHMGTKCKYVKYFPTTKTHRDDEIRNKFSMLISSSKPNDWLTNNKTNCARILVRRCGGGRGYENKNKTAI